MEVFQTENYYIFLKRDKSLWWNRYTSEFSIKAGWDLSSVDDIECIGITHGIVGVVSLPNVYEPHLIIVKEATPVGVLYPPHLVYKIKSICILSADEPDATLTPCSKHSKSANTTPTHSAGSSSTTSLNANVSNAAATANTKTKLFERNQLMNKTWGAVKSAGNTIKNTTQQAAALASNQVKSSVGIRDPTRIEKRITEELHKIFDETDSFYFCFEHDITNNLQRHQYISAAVDGNGGIVGVGQTTVNGQQQQPDERFFWNRHMIEPLLALNDKTWILPIIQGFVQVENCVIGNECFTLALVSRRSRHRAGTRYKRRGVDENGNCANYVETEQILTFRHHQLSFTQVRGSVPIYWSQPGYKYRPPPRLDRGEPETQEAFEKHFSQELSIYEGVCVVNLVEQSGKEKLIGDAFAKHVIKYNNERVIYVTFDFHDYCRGMHFENVSALVEALAAEAGAMGFHWRDQRGVICNQKSVFRVNCMDCLDRTNVVQTALGKAVLESQLVKLGLAPPYTPIPEQLKSPFMILWANNGDIISRQYAGTNALKGDFTRTGERKISGMMKDGMNSANRYYLARFKDSYRQATIDLMLGNQVTAESLNALGGQQAAPDETDALEGAEHAKLLVEDCRRLLLGSSQYPVGAWGLIDADPSTGDINETEVDSILLLTDEHYIVAEYDAHLDKITRFEKVALKNVTLIELGMYQQNKIFQGSAPAMLCLRLNYSLEGVDGYFHMFRSANIRFFNNVAYVIKSQDEISESLMSIVDMFRIALDTVSNHEVRFVTGGVLQRRKSKNPMLEVPKGMPRNLSESQLVQLSSKALFNMAGQFSKLGQTLNPNKSKAAAANNNNHAASSKANTTAQINPQVMQRSQPSLDKCIEAEKASFRVGGAKNKPYSNSSSDSEEQDSSIYEPELDSDVDLALSAASTADATAGGGFNENDFLPSVGIVMANSATGDNIAEASEQHLQDKNSMLKCSSNLNAMSISSVTDHVTMPSGLLENAAPVRPITPNPLICIEPDEAQEAMGAAARIELATAAAGSCSSAEHSRSASPIAEMMSSSMEGGKLKQLKSMTTPLSKIAKGMQNIGLNLDPRKIAAKTSIVLSPSSGAAAGDADTLPERGANSKVQLQEMWAEHQCQTKLIAL